MKGMHQKQIIFILHIFDFIFQCCIFSLCLSHGISASNWHQPCVIGFNKANVLCIYLRNYCYLMLYSHSLKQDRVISFFRSFCTIEPSISRINTSILTSIQKCNNFELMAHDSSAFPKFILSRNSFTFFQKLQNIKHTYY